MNTTTKNIRVMWLLNQTTLREFEVTLLKEMGVIEIFTPKFFPCDEGLISASIDMSLDKELSIPEEDLVTLNAQDWYGSPSREAWVVANKYFHIVFIGLFPEQIHSTINNFNGVITLRALNNPEGHSYTQILYDLVGREGVLKIKSIADRFRLATPYKKIKTIKSDILKGRHCFLPLGLKVEKTKYEWTGDIKKIYFVCPHIATSFYFKNIFESFKQDFKDFDFVIGGEQPIRVNEPVVLEQESKEVCEGLIYQYRVMFLHNAKQSKFYYYPFEAIRAGVPIVFMAGGILDKFGGKKLPGRCTSIKEARRKIKKILNDDWRLIKKIRNSQLSLLEPMKLENCRDDWSAGFQCILDSLKKNQINMLDISNRKKRIAIIVPTDVRREESRNAKLLAQAIELGSRQVGEGVEVVLGYLDDQNYCFDDYFIDLPTFIKKRSFHWRSMSREEAYRAMVYAGLETPMHSESYLIPDDGINQFMDCDSWILISDSLSHPLLPIRPYVLMVNGYPQRYESLVSQPGFQGIKNISRSAESVIVSSEFTRQDAIQYAGLTESRIIKLPKIVDEISLPSNATTNKKEQGYFLWRTKIEQHENLQNVLNALQIYYEEYEGKLECRVEGFNWKKILKSNLPNHKSLRKILSNSSLLKQYMKFLGELSSQAFHTQLAGSEFLWNASRLSNETYTVVDATQLGVPVLTRDHPEMNEINVQLGLNLSWMDTQDPKNMASQLKLMEKEAKKLRSKLPSPEQLSVLSVEYLARTYWEAVREYL